MDQISFHDALLLEPGVPTGAEEKVSLIRPDTKEASSSRQQQLQPGRQEKKTMSALRRFWIGLLIVAVGWLSLVSAFSPPRPCHDGSDGFTSPYRPDSSSGGRELEDGEGPPSSPPSAPPSSFADLLSGASPEALHRLLHDYFPHRYRHGVYESDGSALAAVRAQDPPLATALARLARRQNDTSPTTSAAPPPATSTAPPPPPPPTTTAAPPPPPASSSDPPLSPAGNPTTSAAPPPAGGGGTSSAGPATSPPPPSGGGGSSSAPPPPPDGSSVSQAGNGGGVTAATTAPPQPGESTSAAATPPPPAASSSAAAPSSGAGVAASSAAAAGGTTLVTSAIPPAPTAAGASSRTVTSTYVSTLADGALVTLYSTAVVWDAPPETAAISGTRAPGSLQTGAASGGWNRRDRVVEAIVGAAAIGGALLV